MKRVYCLEIGAYARVERGPSRVGISEQGASSSAVGVELEVVELKRGAVRLQGLGDLVSRGGLGHGGDNRGGHLLDSFEDLMCQRVSIAEYAFLLRTAIA